MRFADFLRTTVLISAGRGERPGRGDRGRRASATAAVWSYSWPPAGGWSPPASASGLGRGGGTSAQIASLLASARMQPSLPEVNPGRTLVNRLWPLLVSTIGAGALAFVLPQVPAVATGFAIIWALAWRRQPSAVTAIEERDGARFYVIKTSPLQPIKLVRTPGFRSNLYELNGSSGRAPRARPRA